MAKTERLDVLAVERGLFSSRESARTAIMDGAVLVDGDKQTKPGTKLRADARIELIPSFQTAKYVSRGGLKLEKALSVFKVDPANRICLDIGASTGGFTDCLIQHAAKLVYAVDVGYGQLDFKLRRDERVIVKERVNARFLTAEMLYGDSSERADLAVMDVSFISVTKIWSACLPLLATSKAEIISLIKPQFEAGKEAVGKGGVVKSSAVHLSILETVCNQAASLGLAVAGLTFSPITGPAGNIEFLLHLKRDLDSSIATCSSSAAQVVAEAHSQLKK